LEVSVLSDLKDGFLIKSHENKDEKDLAQAYLDLIDLFNDKRHISLLQDFSKQKVILSLERFEELIKRCRDQGVITLHVATITQDMSRAYTGVIFQEISDKYEIDMQIYYCSDLLSAKKWLRTSHNPA